MIADGYNIRMSGDEGGGSSAFGLRLVVAVYDRLYAMLRLKSSRASCKSSLLQKHFTKCTRLTAGIVMQPKDIQTHSICAFGKARWMGTGLGS